MNGLKKMSTKAERRVLRERSTLLKLHTEWKVLKAAGQGDMEVEIYRGKLEVLKSKIHTAMMDLERAKHCNEGGG